jgi:predicted ester cyclase
MTILKNTVLAAVAAWNSGDLQGYLELYDRRVRVHGYRNGTLDINGMRDLCEEVWDALPGTPGPNPHLIVDRMLEEGDSLAVRFVMTGLHVRPFLGIAATGRSYVMPGISIMHFDGLRCIERWVNTDSLRLFVQLGAVQMPGA